MYVTEDALRSRHLLHVVQEQPAAHLLDVLGTFDRNASGDVDGRGFVTPGEAGHVRGHEDDQAVAPVLDIGHHGHVDPTIADAKEGVRTLSHERLGLGEVAGEQGTMPAVPLLLAPDARFLRGAWGLSFKQELNSTKNEDP